MLLTISPLSPDLGLEAIPAATSHIAKARALLLPPDDLPVADLTGQPTRWAQLQVIGRAHAAGLSILAWGNGAALLGRSWGLQVVTGHVAGAWQWHTPKYQALTGNTLDYTGEYCAKVPEAHILADVAGVPALWGRGNALALLDPAPSAELIHTLLNNLPAPLRLSTTPLEAIGGSEALRAVLTDFYAQCRADPLLAPTFARVHDWPQHMRGVQQFWETMLGEPEHLGAWRGNLNHIHAPLRVSNVQLERWLELLSLSAKRSLTPQGAELLLGRARAMRARLGRRGNKL